MGSAFRPICVITEQTTRQQRCRSWRGAQLV